MTTTVDALRRVPLFAGMTDRALAAVAELTTEVTFPDGAVLAREGDPGDAFYLLLDGQVDITRGGEPVRRLGPGEFMGEISLVDARPRTATAIAVGRVLALSVRSDAFGELMDRFAAVRLGVLMALTERVRSDTGSEIA